jgi:hypothetical protein
MLSLIPGMTERAVLPRTGGEDAAFRAEERHELATGRGPAVVFTTKLSRLQRRILRLLNMSGVYDI